VDVGDHSDDGHTDWPDDAGASTQASDSGVTCVLVASPDRRGTQSICGYLVDTWCLGVKNAIGPQRMRPRELEAFKRKYFGQWRSEGIPVPLKLAQHLVLGAVDYARSLGFDPHPDFRRARRALGSWDGPSAITFGMNGKPLYVDGPLRRPAASTRHARAQRWSRRISLQRLVGARRRAR
jgi:hypothetical protein